MTINKLDDSFSYLISDPFINFYIFFFLLLFKDCDLPPRVLPWLAELSMTETNEDLMYNELDDNSLADAVEHIEQSRQTLELEDDELISATETQ